MKGIVILCLFFKGIDAFWNLSYGNHKYHQDQNDGLDGFFESSWLIKLLRNAVGKLSAIKFKSKTSFRWLPRTNRVIFSLYLNENKKFLLISILEKGLEKQILNEQ